MRLYTNMARPDDPYRTGQQLYRRPGPELAAFAVRWRTRDHRAPCAVAVVHLPLHRTRVLTVTEGTLGFGFRAATAGDEAGLPAVAALADLALMQTRRHAVFLAAEAPLADLSALRRLASGGPHRGLAAVEAEWGSRAAAPRGKARMIDSAIDLPGRERAACGPAGIAPPVLSLQAGDQAAAEPGPLDEDELLAAETAGQALVIALACARQAGRYRWAGTLRVAALMAAAAWDSFPNVTWNDDPSPPDLVCPPLQPAEEE